MSKTFTSKTVSHIGSYSYVDLLVSYLLSFSLIAYAYKLVFLPLWSLVNENIISPYPIVHDNLAKVDSLVDGFILSDLLDKWVLTYPIETVKELEAKYIKPTNDYFYDSVVNKYLPKAEYKFDEGIAETKKFFVIINELLLRLKAQVSNTSTEISNDIISTYNSEIQELSKSTENAKSNLKSNLTASYNTASKSFTKINEAYIQPIKTQTQGYVTEVATSTKNRADSFISEAKLTFTQTNKQANAAAEDLSEKATELLNGTTNTISASAWGHRCEINYFFCFW